VCSSAPASSGERLERERGREGERSKSEKVKKIWGFFANVRHRGTTWRATSASNACVARLGPGMNHLTKFRDLIRRFESLGT